MKLLRTKKWPAIDIAFLKWSCILFGMIIGAYLNAFVKEYVLIFIILVILLAIKPMITYWKKEE